MGLCFFVVAIIRTNKDEQQQFFVFWFIYFRGFLYANTFVQNYKILLFNLYLASSCNLVASFIN